ncbi:ADP-ribosylglycohydrolase [Seminavis robusta]|uniref:ADP-ribosylglycohydrolase n=1 Tax=Seminavis robusta TaxID=568900 RepID=A0A9N8HCX6_9STRA|nr:ADP-ribosylglycohydrolase [Seminavis robusta]|eukprot:Sro320_g116590.1 ADP-ribosylglycohydrolase (358) ;mRNA; f:65739-66812
MTSLLIQNRVTAALRGAFVADAASMGTHWIYDPAEMLKTVTSVETPEFRDPPSPKYYSATDFPGHYQNGMLSPYGEQLLFVTEHVASTMDLTGDAMSQEMFQWATTFGGRPDHALTTFIDNIKADKKFPECGADDDQAHIYMKVVPVVARYHGKPDLVDRLSQAVRVHQNNQKAVAFGIAAARILEAVILGAPLEEALETCQQNIKDDLANANVPNDAQEALMEAFQNAKTLGKEKSTLDEILLEVSHQKMKGNEDSNFYDLAGRSCALPGSFIGPIALFYKSASNAAASTTLFASALRENILASGDTCSRSVFIGAVFAALAANEKSDSLPSDWVEKMDPETLKKVDAAIGTIVST